MEVERVCFNDAAIMSDEKEDELYICARTCLDRRYPSEICKMLTNTDTSH